MKPKTMILMVVAVACGLGASFMTSRYIKAQKPPEVEEELVMVVVSKTRVQPYSAIKDPDKFFEVKPYPKRLAPKNPITNLTEVKDQRLKIGLEEHSPVSKDQLVDKNTEGLEWQLAPGQRAVAIRVNTETVVGGFVLPKTRVDIAVTLRGAEVSSKLLLQNILVLAVDAADTRDPEKKNIASQNVTLAVTPEEALRLSVGASMGELRLWLKGQGDTALLAPMTVKLTDLDRPLSTQRQPDEVEEAPPAGAGGGPITLPVLKDMPQEEEPAPRTKEPEPEPEPKKKQEKRHVLTIIGKTAKQFTYRHQKELDAEEQGTDAADDPPAREERKEERPRVPEKKEEPKVSGPKQATSAYGPRTTRTNNR